MSVYKELLDRRSINSISKKSELSLIWILDRYLGLTHMKAANKDVGLQQAIPDIVTCCNTNGFVYLSKKSRSKKARQLQGTLESILKNLIKGIQSGTEIKLKLTGVGYRAKIEENRLVLDLGFSHPIHVSIPDQIKVSMPDNTSIVLFSTNKEKVGSFSAMLRGLRPPEPYKGKGVQYVNETVILKSGKSKR